ncbi:MAG: hypothetical protein QNJ72_42200 [Pleurocapsa sp. MO_226.B13]|nr:hypothetical protein [Pleurocapsa sp. MO_226.B13]
MMTNRSSNGKHEHHPTKPSINDFETIESIDQFNKSNRVHHSQTINSQGSTAPPMPNQNLDPQNFQNMQMLMMQQMMQQMQALINHQGASASSSSSNVGHPSQFQAPFRPLDLIDERPSSDELNNIENATEPDSRVAIELTEQGVFRDAQELIWYVFDEQTGLWSKTSDEGFHQLISEKYNEILLNDFDSFVLPTKKLLEKIATKIKIANRKYFNQNTWKTNWQSNVIPFSNGLLDLETRKLLPLTKDLLLESKLDRDYDETAGTNCPNYIDLINHISNQDSEVAEVLHARTLLHLTGRGHLQRSILLLHSTVGGCGKGTYINLLEKLTGEYRSATLDLCRLNDGTTLSTLSNKTSLLFPEERSHIGPRSQSYANILKISSHDTISGRVIFSKGNFSYKSNAMMVIASNYAVLNVSDGGLSRRTLVLEVKHHPKHVDLYLADKLSGELAQITNYLLEKFDFDPDQAREIVSNANEINAFKHFAQDNAEESNTLIEFLKTYVTPVCPINRDRELTVKEYNQLPKQYREDNPPAAISAQSLYSAYKIYMNENNPGSGLMKKSRFEKEVILYYKCICNHEIYIVEETAIPGLCGRKKRILGLIPSVSWKQEDILLGLKA